MPRKRIDRNIYFRKHVSSQRGRNITLTLNLRNFYVKREFIYWNIIATLFSNNNPRGYHEDLVFLWVISTELTGSRTPASGAMKPSSPALCTAFSRDLRSWSTGAHSPRAARPRSLWAPSLAVAPAELGLLPGCDGSPPTAPPLLPVEVAPSSLPPDGLSSLLDALFLSSLPPGGFLLLLFMLRRTIPARRTRAWFARATHSCSRSLAFMPRKDHQVSSSSSVKRTRYTLTEWKIYDILQRLSRNAISKSPLQHGRKVALSRRRYGKEDLE